MMYETIQDAQVPKVGFGTWNLRGRACYQATLSALEIGYRHIDTAEFYDNEEQVGRAIADSGLDRDQLYLVSKVWDNHLRRDDVISACETSLRKLGVETLDLYLIHWPSPAVPIEETMQGMVELVRSGKARAIGVSNFSVSQQAAAQAASEVKLLCNQVRYHPYYPQTELLEYCRGEQVLLAAYSPLAKGRLARDRTLAEIGEQHGKVAAQVALRWLVQQPGVVTIPKSADPLRQRENFDVFDFELSQAEMDRISALAE